MNRSILGIKLQDRIPNTKLRSKTEIRLYSKMGLGGSGHVSRMDGDRAKVIIHWEPMDGAEATVDLGSGG